MKTIKTKDYIIHICKNTEEFINKTTYKDVAYVGKYSTETHIHEYWFNKDAYSDKDAIRHAVVSAMLTRELINAEDLNEKDCGIRAETITCTIKELLKNI